MNYYGDTLYHHGIKGQKWGLRRFQNEDGSLTPAGKKRYGYLEESANKASKFAAYAKEEEKKYSKGLSDSQKKNGVKQSDLDRWKKAATVQRQKYENLAKKYRSIDISKLDKNTIKEAKNFAKKAFYTDVEYADFFSGNKWHNYILKDGSDDYKDFKSTIKNKIYDNPSDHGINPRSKENRIREEEYKDAYGKTTGSIRKQIKYRNKYGPNI